MTRNYSSLRRIATILTFFGWAIQVLGCGVSIVIMFEATFLGGVLALLSSFFYGLILLAVSEVIQVVMDIEENTRSLSNKYENSISSIQQSDPTIKAKQTGFSEITNSAIKLNVNESIITLKTKLNRMGYEVNEISLGDNKWKYEAKKGTDVLFFYSDQEFIQFATDKTKET